MKIRTVAAICLLAMLFAGCSDSESVDKSGGKAGDSAGTAPASKKVKLSRYPVDNLDPTSVVVRVNSRPITQKQYEDWLRLRIGMFREANRLSVRSKDERLGRVKRDSRDRAWNELIRREMLHQEAERLGVVASPSNLVVLQKRFMKQIRHGKEDFEKIDSIFGSRDADLIRGYLESVALEDACLEAATTNDISHVSDEELDAKIKYINEWNARAAESNAVQIAKAKAAKAEILAGAKFYDVTTNRAEFAHEDGYEWQDVALGDFEADDPLAQWLMTAKPGDISDPINLEDGISIVGLRMVYDDEEDEGESPEKQYSLVRCAFHAFQEFEEVEDREQFRKDLLQEKRNAAMRQLGQRLVDSSTVEFPYGEEIFRERKGSKARKSTKDSKPAAKADKASKEEQK